MKYLGGKSKTGHVIVREIEKYREPGKPFVDVFMGALNIVRHAKAPRYAFDANRALVTLFQRVIAGTWDPPRTLSEQEYMRIKANPSMDDPVTAFALIGCSFGAKWAGGYARAERGSTDGTKYATEARNGLLEKARACRDVVVRYSDYRAIPDFGSGAVYYLDPPYEGTTGYAGVGPFNSNIFWTTAARWVTEGKLVFVSEGADAPLRPGWVVFREWWTPQRMEGKAKEERKPRVERLIVHESSPMAASPTSFHRIAQRSK